MHITSKGQVTIPVEIRNTMGLTPHTEVEFKVEDGRIILQTKASDNPLQRFRGIDKGRYTTDEVMKLTRG